MTFLEECHQAHVERVVRLSQRLPQAGPLRTKPKPKVIRFDEKGRRIVPPAPPAPRLPLPNYPPLPTPLQEIPITRPLMILDVVRVVAAAYGLTVREILDRSTRQLRIYRPRQVAMHLTYTLGVASLLKIARCMGGFDHTVVIYSIKRIMLIRLTHTNAEAY